MAKSVKKAQSVHGSSVFTVKLTALSACNYSNSITQYHLTFTCFEQHQNLLLTKPITMTGAKKLHINPSWTVSQQLKKQARANTYNVDCINLLKGIRIFCCIFQYI